MSGLTLSSFAPRPSRSGLLACAGVLSVMAGLALGLTSGSSRETLLLALLSGALAAFIGAGATTVIRDRRQRAAARAAEHLWRDLAEVLPVALALVDRSGRLMRANDAFHNLLPEAGRSPLVALRRRLADGDAVSGVVARLSLAIGEGRSSETEVQLSGSDDICASVHWRSATPVDTRSG